MLGLRNTFVTPSIHVFVVVLAPYSCNSLSGAFYLLYLPANLLIGRNPRGLRGAPPHLDIGIILLSHAIPGIILNFYIHLRHNGPTCLGWTHMPDIWQVLGLQAANTPPIPHIASLTLCLYIASIFGFIQNSEKGRIKQRKRWYERISTKQNFCLADYKTSIKSSGVTSHMVNFAIPKRAYFKSLCWDYGSLEFYV